MSMVAEDSPLSLAATSAIIGTLDIPSCALLSLYCSDTVSIWRDISVVGRLRASAQISRRSTSTESRGTIFSRAGTRPVIDSEVKLELHRQAKVMRRGNNYSPNKYRKQEERRGVNRSDVCIPILESIGDRH